MNSSTSAQPDHTNQSTVASNIQPARVVTTSRQASSRRVTILNSNQVSFDGPAARTPRPKMRAEQLANYTRWLENQQDTAAAAPAISKPAESSAATSPSTQAQSQKVYRLDVPHDNLIGLSKSASGVSAAPHFETTNYVPPQPLTAAQVTAKNNQETARLKVRDIPTDGFDPQIGIKNHIKEIQAAGHMVGQLQSGEQIQISPAKSLEVTQIETAIELATRSDLNAHAVDELMVNYGQTSEPASASPDSVTKTHSAPEAHATAAPYSTSAAAPTTTAAPTTSKAPIAAPSFQSFQPAWRQASFSWPSISTKLLDESGSSIGQLECAITDVLGKLQNRVAITSSRRGEGCSTITISLARWARRQSKQVLLVDGDLSYPSLANLAGIQPNVSWFHTINGARDTGEVVIQSIESGLCVMPMNQVITRSNWPANLLDQLANAVDTIASHFDLIVFDMGPFSQVVTEISHPTHLADAFVLANATNQTSSVERNQTQNNLQAAGVQKLIIADNFVYDHALEPALVG